MQTPDYDILMPRQDHYRINIALDGRHFAAVYLTFVDEAEARDRFREFKERFWERDFQVTMTHWQFRGKDISIP